MSIEETLRRINELARKSKTDGLTPEEQKEQEILRRKYIDAFKSSLRSQLDSIRWTDQENQSGGTNHGSQLGENN